MSRRIAHRPRYRNIPTMVRPTGHSRKEFFSWHWTYRPLTIPYQKRLPGQGLRLLPFHRLVHSVLMR
jgi:hypothetical protein